MATPETVGQFADAVRAAVDAERERIKAIVREGADLRPNLGWGDVTPDEAIEAVCNELLRRIEEGR